MCIILKNCKSLYVGSCTAHFQWGVSSNYKISKPSQKKPGSGSGYKWPMVDRTLRLQNSGSSWTWIQNGPCECPGLQKSCIEVERLSLPHEQRVVANGMSFLLVGLDRGDVGRTFWRDVHLLYINKFPEVAGISDMWNHKMLFGATALVLCCLLSTAPPRSGLLIHLGPLFFSLDLSVGPTDKSPRKRRRLPWALLTPSRYPVNIWKLYDISEIWAGLASNIAGGSWERIRTV